MQNNNSRIAKNSMFLYVRMLFAMGVNLYTSRVILQVLGVEDFGIYSIVGGVIAMFSFLNNAMTNSTQRFFSFEIGKKNFEGLKKTFSASLTIHLLIGLIIIGLAETLGLWFVNNNLNFPQEKTHSVLWLYQITIFTFFLTIVQVPYKASLIANERFKVYSVISIIEIVLKLVAVWLLVYLGTDKIVTYGILTFIVTILVLVCYVYYCLINFRECVFQFIYDANLYGSLLSYTSWNLFGNAASVGANQGVNLLLNMFFGPVVNASRGIAFQIQGAVNSFVLNIQIAVNPQIIKSYAENDLTYMNQLIFKSTKYCCLLLVLISLPLFFETSIILKLWLKNVPPYSIIFTRLILVNIIIESLSGPIMTAAQATGKIKIYQILVGCTLLLNLPISYLLLYFDAAPESTMYAGIFIAILALIVRLVLIKKMMGLSITTFLKEVIFKTISPVLTTLPFVFFIYNALDEGFVRLVLLTFVSSIIFVMSVYFLGIDVIERDFIRGKLKMLVRRSIKSHKQ